MFWGLAAGVVDPRGFEFEHVLRDIQTLNEWALEGRSKVSAISLHAYPFVQDGYASSRTARAWARATGPSSSRGRSSAGTTYARSRSPCPGG